MHQTLPPDLFLVTQQCTQVYWQENQQHACKKNLPTLKAELHRTLLAALPELPGPKLAAYKSFATRTLNSLFLTKVAQEGTQAVEPEATPEEKPKAELPHTIVQRIQKRKAHLTNTTEFPDQQLVGKEFLRNITGWSKVTQKSYLRRVANLGITVRDVRKATIFQDKPRQEALSELLEAVDSPHDFRDDLAPKPKPQPLVPSISARALRRKSRKAAIPPVSTAVPPEVVCSGPALASTEPIAQAVPPITGAQLAEVVKKLADLDEKAEILGLELDDIRLETAKLRKSLNLPT